MSFTRESWSREDYTELLKHLSALGEDSYKSFNNKIIPDAVEPFGIRVPVLKALAKEIAKGDFRGFLTLPHGNRHEEIILRGLVMAAAKTDYDEMLDFMKSFASDINNWAVCDTVDFKGIKKNRERFWRDSRFFTEHDNPWFIRFGLEALMKYYLDDGYINEVLQCTAAVKSEFYYVKMMQAWLYATAAAKCREQTLAFLSDTPLDSELARMTVGKMRDSSRVSSEDAAVIKAKLLKI